MKETRYFCDLCGIEVENVKFLYRIDFVSNIREVDGCGAQTLTLKDVCPGCCEAALNTLKVSAKELPATIDKL